MNGCSVVQRIDFGKSKRVVDDRSKSNGVPFSVRANT
jgi:hypothetical protein